MSVLTQREIDNLDPEAYCRLLAYGDIELIDDDEISETYERELRRFIEFDL